MADLVARTATIDDVDLLLEWRNDPLVRSVSRSQAPIERSEYKRWLKDRLNSSASFPLIVTFPGGEPVGHVRFDIEMDDAEVSIFLAPSMRGQGLGTSALSVAQEAFRSINPHVKLRAFVKRDNAASHQLFRLAGYQLESADDEGSWYVDAGIVTNC